VSDVRRHVKERDCERWRCLGRYERADAERCGTARPDRPWFDKWIDMQRAIERLRSAYKSVPSGGNVEVDGYVRQFFGALSRHA